MKTLQDLELHLDVSTSFFEVVLNGIPSRFMDGICLDSGDTSFIPVLQGETIVWFRLGWESDCDGSFYWNSKTPKEDIIEFLPDLKVIYGYCPNPIDLVKYFVKNA